MDPEYSEPFKAGIGRTSELTLRVSVAALVRVLVEHPGDGNLMLALERRATVHETRTVPVVEVKSQPFGGALRIHGLRSLQTLISDFHFDSEKSHSEQDFRIFIRPADWEAVREFCLKHLSHPEASVLESNPTRELTEEVAETLGIRLKRDQYSYQAVGTIIEDQPTPTENLNARGHPTVRIYRIFEARILDTSLASAMNWNSHKYSDHELTSRALDNSQNGGPGRANAVLTLPFKQLISLYSILSPETRNRPISFNNHQLDETVAAVLDIDVPKYRRVLS